MHAAASQDWDLIIMFLLCLINCYGELGVYQGSRPWFAICAADVGMFDAGLLHAQLHEVCA